MAVPAVVEPSRRDAFFSALAGYVERNPGAMKVRAQADGQAEGNTIYTGDLNDPRFKEFLRSGGGSATTSGAIVTPRTSTRVTAVLACVRLISRVIAMLPYGLFEELPDSKKRKATERKLHKVLSLRANRWQTAFDFWSMLIAHVLLRGNAYALIVRSLGDVLELIPLHPDRMEVEQLADLSLRYTYTRADGSRIVIAQKDLLHLRDLSDDGIKGMSVIAQAADAIGLAMQAERAGARLFKHGNLNGGVLSSDQLLGKETVDGLKSDLKEFSGAENAGKWLVLEAGLEPKSLGLSLADLQFIESRQFSVEDIARIFGVPPHMIGAVSKSTSFGTGIVNQTTGFVQFVVLPWNTNIDQTVSRDCLSDADAGRFYAKRDMRELLMGTPDDQAKFFESMLGKPGQKGWGSQNEVRAMIDMDRSDDPGADSIEPLVTTATQAPGAPTGTKP